MRAKLPLFLAVSLIFSSAVTSVAADFIEIPAYGGGQPQYYHAPEAAAGPPYGDIYRTKVERPVSPGNQLFPTPQIPSPVVPTQTVQITVQHNVYYLNGEPRSTPSPDPRVVVPQPRRQEYCPQPPSSPDCGCPPPPPPPHHHHHCHPPCECTHHYQSGHSTLPSHHIPTSYHDPYSQVVPHSYPGHECVHHHPYGHHTVPSHHIPVSYHDPHSHHVPHSHGGCGGAPIPKPSPPPCEYIHHHPYHHHHHTVPSHHIPAGYHDPHGHYVPHSHIGCGCGQHAAFAR